jgi:hypothetical protein
MKKSTLSMFSLICGITATTLGVILFPFTLVFAKTPSGVTFVGMIVLFTIFAGITGTICAIVKRLSTPDDTEENKNDRALAHKGFWFSIIPTIAWIFIMIIGSTIK